MPMLMVSPVVLPAPPPPPHEAMVSATCDPAAMARIFLLMCIALLALVMGQDLAQEDFCSWALRVREERVRVRLLDDLTVIHENNPVRGLPREAHLVGDHEHRHTLSSQRDHHIQHLIYHLRVQGR